MTELQPKPFATHTELVERMERLGLDVGDKAEAARYLRRVGYHRLGGYRYVFRQILREDEIDRETRRFRADEYAPNCTLEEVEKLENWDSELREVVLQGCGDFEIRLREAVAHSLASRDPYGYLDENVLDATECKKLTRKGTKLQAWRDTVHKTVCMAKNEDFIIHHCQTYPNFEIPIWSMTDLLSLGSIPFLIDLMRDVDANSAAERFGLRNGKTLATWTRAIADLRNVCAHHSRLFNRAMKRSIKVQSRDVAPGDLDHLIELTSTRISQMSSGKKPYAAFAILAYMLKSHESYSQWPSRLRTHITRFPNKTFNDPRMPDITATLSCGFPSGFLELDLWK